MKQQKYGAGQRHKWKIIRNDIDIDTEGEKMLEEIFPTIDQRADIEETWDIEDRENEKFLKEDQDIFEDDE